MLWRSAARVTASEYRPRGGSRRRPVELHDVFLDPPVIELHGYPSNPWRKREEARIVPLQHGLPKRGIAEAPKRIARQNGIWLVQHRVR